MTPDEHYVEAERHLEYAMTDTKGSELAWINLHAAQVHATLATVEQPLQLVQESES